MTQCVYLASTEAQSGKAAVALGLISALQKAGKSVGLFRPVVKSVESDSITELLLSAGNLEQSFTETVGVEYDDAHHNLDDALTEIVRKFQDIDDRYDVMVIVGSDWSDVSGNTELELNARISTNLNAPVILVVSGVDQTPQQIRQIAQASLREFRDEHNTALAVVANRVTGVDDVTIREALADLAPVVAAIPENKILSAPTVRAQFAATGAIQIAGKEEALADESLHTLVAGMTLPNVLKRLQPECTLVAASDRRDLLKGILDRHAEDDSLLNGLILVGGHDIPTEVLVRLHKTSLPVGAVDTDTYETASKLVRLYGSLEPGHPRKIAAAQEAFDEHVDEEQLVKTIVESNSTIRTPLMFEYQLQTMARQHRQRIVLPEAVDDRILEAASIVGERDFADIILLGNEDTIHARAHELGFNLDRAHVVNPTDEHLVDRFAAEYVELRKHKGVTMDQARQKMEDLSYVGTMMVHLGMADGMVSGAVNTTANTIRPSFEFIKTKPGVSIVSSVFFMCMPDRVLVFGDCAINPNPNPEQLADIAVSSAATAAKFGIDPRVAMLSYSTGTSGAGEDVDAVAQATEMAKGRNSGHKIDGPIQFDAAVDMTVGKKKMPGSEVAGQATVFIFPDLNTGNNTYKAVQRSSGALAIGPLLQGLNKPVNDLSRGALVDDIVNTIALTAIQAQDEDNATQEDPA